MADSRRHHEGDAAGLVLALFNGLLFHERVRQLLTEGFRRTRGEVATVLGLGSDAAGRVIRRPSMARPGSTND